MHENQIEAMLDKIERHVLTHDHNYVNHVALLSNHPSIHPSTQHSLGNDRLGRPKPSQALLPLLSLATLFPQEKRQDDECGEFFAILSSYNLVL
jgi:hypothetical protein